MIENFVPTWLMIKQHNQTGLKYFCKTVGKDPIKYLGSGKYWKNHLMKHGNDVSTTWCQLFEDKDQLTEYALTFSKENNIVESKEWANLKPEDGLWGGSVKGRTMSQSQRDKIGKANTGKIHSLEFRENIRRKLTGRKGIFHHSEETLAGMKGENNHFYGKHHTEYSKQKVSAAKKGCRWWNNGNQCKTAKECPGEEWTLGRLPTRQPRILLSVLQ